MNSHPFEVEVFYDGGCPLCSREIDMIRSRDHARLIRFTDIDAPNFDAWSVGKTQDELMAQLHGRLPDGTWIKGLETFRRIYAAIGFCRTVKISRWPIVAQILDVGYWIFARYRLPLTGRCKQELCALPVSSSETLKK